jgi:hypothetical protein
VIVEYVEDVEGCDGLSDETLDVRWIRDVTSQSEGLSSLAADPLRDLLGRLGPNVHHRDGCALGREELRGRRPDARSGAGDQRYLPLEPTHQPPSSVPLLVHHHSGASWVVVVSHIGPAGKSMVASGGR